MGNNPLVSAVIPTRNRPKLVCRAVRSALNQTYKDLEVIVVVDGPDPATVELLEKLREPRVRIVALAENAGGSQARNIGVREARGEWIAFLDDDDEWMMTKIARQLQLVCTSNNPLTFIACQYVDKCRQGNRILPLKTKDPEERFSDYLFFRRSLFGGGGYVQTSTWFVSRELANLVKFTPGLKRNQDIDWMLRAVEGRKADFRLLMEPLAIFHQEETSTRLSKTRDWRFQLEWALSNKEYLSNNALAYFLSTTCAADAAGEGDYWQSFVRICSEIIKVRALSGRCVLFLAYYLFLPEQTRHSLRLWLTNNTGIRKESKAK